MISSLMRRLHAPVYAARLRELVRQITPHLEEGDRVLDVGCGFGALGRAILDSSTCPPGVEILGLERVKRGNEFIPVEAYDGKTIPHADRALDVVILADVLHHERDPHHLINECVRVSRRLLIIKDHKIEGPLAQQRVALLDWAANAPYDVPCLYQYNTALKWRDWYLRHGLTTEREVMSLHLYPPIYNLIFGRKLQYLAVLRVNNPRMQAARALRIGKDFEGIAERAKTGERSRK